MTIYAQKALVLGGATGLVGQALVGALRNFGWQVYNTNRSDVDFTAPDAADRLKALIDARQPSCIFNTVGYTQVDEAEKSPDKATLLNRTLPAMLGRIVKERPCTLVHFSTDFVFNGKKKEPYTTEDAPVPLNVYGRSKLEGERALLTLDLTHLLIIRTGWLFGPGRCNFVSTILQRCQQTPFLAVVHDQIGSPTYTPDLAHCTLKLVNAGIRGLFHVANSGQASWCELAGEAISLAQMECMVNPVSSCAYPQLARRPAYSVLDCQHFAQATGITPRPWPQSLREYIFKVFPPE